MQRKEMQAKCLNVQPVWLSFDVESSEATGEYTATYDIPANCIVERVLAYVITRCLVSTGTAKFELGTTDDSDGYIIEQDISAAARPSQLQQKLMGNDIDELGELFAIPGTVSEDATYSNREPRITTPESVYGQFSSDAITAQAKITIATAAALNKGQVRVWMKVLRLHLDP